MELELKGQESRPLRYIAATQADKGNIPKVFIYLFG
jgi:hypothetical protein